MIGTVVITVAYKNVSFRLLVHLVLVAKTLCSFF